MGTELVVDIVGNGVVIIATGVGAGVIFKPQLSAARFITYL